MAKQPLRYLILIVFMALSFQLLLNIDIAEAASVKKIKGKKVLIVLDEMNAQKGDLVYAINKKGKKT